MKSLNQVLVAAAVSMTALVGASAHAAQPSAGEQPVFESFKYESTGGAANPAEVQAQARQAIQEHAFDNQMTSNVDAAQHTQATALNRAQVSAKAQEAMNANQIRVGGG